jgi:hypothetical protein
VLEELFATIQLDNASDCSGEGSSSDEEHLTLSHCVVMGIQGRKTIRLLGRIDKKQILILVDSGSSATFISSKAVEQLGYSTQAAPEVKVTVASGSQMTSNQQVQEVTWWTQGNTFSASTRVLELPHYDLILGMDWLERFSPMWVHWRRKKLRFTYNGKDITLQGIKDCTTQCNKIKVLKLKGLIKKEGVAQLVQLSPISNHNNGIAIPEEIQQVVEQHDYLFQDPKGLPPN